MRSEFFSRRLIFYGDIFYFWWLWYGLGGVIVELAHKSTTGKADWGCSKEQTKKKRQQKVFLSSSHRGKIALCDLCEKPQRKNR